MQRQSWYRPNKDCIKVAQTVFAQQRGTLAIADLLYLLIYRLCRICCYWWQHLKTIPYGGGCSMTADLQVSQLWYRTGATVTVTGNAWWPLEYLSPAASNSPNCNCQLTKCCAHDNGESRDTSFNSNANYPTVKLTERRLLQLALPVVLNGIPWTGTVSGCFSTVSGCSSTASFPELHVYIS